MNMNIPGAAKWVRTAIISCLGGGIAGAFAAAMDPTKYDLSHDIGSGKLWKFFGLGALLTLGALLLKSPLGQQVMSAYKDSRAQLEQNKADLEAVKNALKKPPGAEK